MSNKHFKEDRNANNEEIIALEKHKYTNFKQTFNWIPNLIKSINVSLEKAEKRILIKCKACWEKRWFRLVFISSSVFLCDTIIQCIVKIYDIHLFEMKLAGDNFINVLQSIWLGQLTLCSLTVPFLLYLFSNKKEEYGYSTIQIIEFRHNHGLKFFSFVDFLILPFILIIINYYYMVNLKSIPLVFNLLLIIILIIFLISSISKYIIDKHKSTITIYKTLQKLIVKYDDKEDEFNEIIDDITTYIYIENYKSIKLQVFFTFENMNELFCNYLKSYKYIKSDDVFLKIAEKFKGVFKIIYEIIISNNDSDMFHITMMMMIKSYIKVFRFIIDPTNDNDTLEDKKELILKTLKENVLNFLQESISNTLIGKFTFNLDVSNILPKICMKLNDMYLNDIETLKLIIEIIKPFSYLINTLLDNNCIDTSKNSYYLIYKNMISKLYDKLSKSDQ